MKVARHAYTHCAKADKSSFHSLKMIVAANAATVEFE
jgi:hypothetical protein